MIELPDDELDKLFRKSSEELDPTYEPDDWNDLRKRLDQQDGRTPAGWWRKWWPLGVLALLIPMGIALYSWDNEKANVSATAPQRHAPAEPAGTQAVKRNGTATPDQDAYSVAAPSPETGRAIKTEPNIAAAEPETGTPARMHNKTDAGFRKTGKSSSQSDLNAAVTNSGATLPRSRSKAGGVYLEPNRSKVEGGDGAFSIIPTDETAGSAVEPARTLISASALDSKALKWNALQLPEVAAPEQEVIPEPAPEQSSMSADDRPLVAIRFGYSPDLSTVGLKDFTKPGTSVSLLAEYSVLPRLFIQSGAVWSRKDYYAPADAYQLPVKNHYYPPAMTGIDGVCKVLEVPLNVRYDIALGARSRWFAGGGFSSYHMNSEKYKYYFVNENDPKITNRSWKGKTGWYWLSHANISAGYEYRLSRKLSLLAEPSIRMPLKRVGYGKVNLITTGLWLSVRYTPVFK